MGPSPLCKLKVWPPQLEHFVGAGKQVMEFLNNPQTEELFMLSLVMIISQKAFLNSHYYLGMRITRLS